MASEGTVEPELGEQHAYVLRPNTDQLCDLPLPERQVVPDDRLAVGSRHEGSEKTFEPFKCGARLLTELVETGANLAGMHLMNPPGACGVFDEQPTKLRRGHPSDSAGNRRDGRRHTRFVGDGSGRADHPTMGAESNDPLGVAVPMTPDQLDEPTLDEKDALGELILPTKDAAGAEVTRGWETADSLGQWYGEVFELLGAERRQGNLGHPEFSLRATSIYEGYEPGAGLCSSGCGPSNHDGSNCASRDRANRCPKRSQFHIARVRRSHAA